MKLNAICIMKNEADIVIETLKNALVFCDNIYVFDNGSDDGTWELVNALAQKEPRLIMVCQSNEVYRNQFRNRVYNQFYQQFSQEDWWYILDADEILAEDPREKLSKAFKKGYQAMDVWQAQFYFTEKDLENYPKEDKNAFISQRRKYYRINWREARFFLNDPNQYWPEDASGRIPKRCKRNAPFAPICKHYAERTPEQIAMRNKIRRANPYSFLHVKNKDAKDWLKQSHNCRYYESDKKLRLSLLDKASYYQRQCGYWLKHRFNFALSFGQKWFGPLS